MVRGILAVPVAETNRTISDFLTVTLLWSGHRLPTYSIEGPDIADLSLETPKANTVPSHGQYAGRENQNVAPQTAKPPAQNAFVDPAILSFSKPPSAEPDTHVVSGGPQAQVVPGGGGPGVESIHPTRAARTEESVVTAALTEPFSNLELNVGSTSTGMPSGLQEPQTGDLAPEEQTDTAPMPAQTKYAGRRSRRGGRNTGTINEHGGASSTNPKSKGWRQTAFVEPSHSHVSQVPRTYKESTAALNRRSRKKRSRGNYAEDPNGWATEDATDIQEMGDFDFQSNLSKFDKRRIFEEFRNGDTTAEEARLVSFNRRARPGTNGGRNLHWTENVLDSPRNSEGEVSEEEESDTKLSSEYYSGRERSKTSTRAQGSRKGSAILGQPLITPQISSIARTSRTTSPRSGKPSVTASPMNGPTSVSAGCLRLTTTNRSCPSVSPLQALEVEQLAAAELGFTEDMLTENAGRGIAEAAVSLLSNDSASPTMLVLTGNHRTGARAITAARHLRNRGHRVTLCMLGLEHENELLESCRKQLEIFRKIGGRVFRWEELSARLSTSDFCPDLVVDALFGIHIAFDDLRNDDQATAFEMVSWVNRSNINVLSVDIPTGLSASSGMCLEYTWLLNCDADLSLSSVGEVTLVEGGRLCVSAKSVVCLGAPKTGVINALLSGEGLAWQITVADIGIPQVVWRKYGTRRRHGIDFGNRWVVPLRFQPPSA